jgi:hypothetical protein
LAIANYSYLTQKSSTAKIEITDEQIAKEAWVYGCTDSTVRAARIAPDVRIDEDRAMSVARGYCECYFQEVLDKGIGIEEMAKDMGSEDTRAGKALVEAKDTCYIRYNNQKTK